MAQDYAVDGYETARNGQLRRAYGVTETRYTVVCRYVWPGRRTTGGNPG
jgi:hypothetical protein